jgi:hypothetical protein
MQSAPPVVYPVGRFFAARWLWLPLYLCGSLWLWWPGLAGLQTSSVQVWGNAAIQTLLVWMAWRNLRADSPAPQDLVWDGAVWTCRWSDGRARPARLEVQADGQDWLWLCLHPWPPARGFSGGPHRRRVLARRSANPVAWHGFRCAVYCRQSQDPDPDRAKGMDAVSGNA